MKMQVGDILPDGSDYRDYVVVDVASGKVITDESIIYADDEKGEFICYEYERDPKTGKRIRIVLDENRQPKRITRKLNIKIVPKPK